MFMLLAAGVIAAALELHVDNRVSNQATHAGVADGSPLRPFRALSHAKAHIIGLRRKSHDHDGHITVEITVLIHGGGGPYAPLAIDHPLLSDTTWTGVPGQSRPVLSGGITVPRARFTRWDHNQNVFVASIAGLGADDLGQMVSGDCVSDCQHDKVGQQKQEQPLPVDSSSGAEVSGAAQQQAAAPAAESSAESSGGSEKPSGGIYNMFYN